MQRQRMSLDGPWEFVLDPAGQLTNTTLGHAGAPRSIGVPGPWQAQFDDLRDYTGVAWYRRTFTVGMDDSGGEPHLWILHFGAVDYFATVWLNGHLLGEHQGGYLPFELDASPAIHLAEANELVVRVVDPSNDTTRFPDYPFSEIPHGKQSWYGPIGGIWQSVYLEARAATHIARLQVTPDVPGAQAQVALSLNMPAAHDLYVNVTLTNPRGQTSAHTANLLAGSGYLTLSVPVPDALLWDIAQPNLYRLTAALSEPAAGVPALDTLSTTFGMRSIATSPSGQILLNGRAIYLRGALDQDYYPELIYTPFSDAALDAQFAKARHMGLNCLRTHIKITDPRYYAAADRAGMLIWTELPNWQNLTAAAKRRARSTLQGMIERDWNHPSIVIWTIINENWGTDLGVNADHRAWLAETYDLVKSLDPQRLVVENSACYGNFHVVTDIEDFHNYYAMPDHYRQWRDWVADFAARPDWAYAHSYADSDTWRALRGDFWQRGPRTHTSEVRRTGTEPLVVSEFGNWGLPDLEQLRAGYGGRDPWWFETGLEWGDGAVYPHGIEQRFARFHLDTVFPTLGDLTRASQRAELVALKYEIEQMRLHSSIVGYVITEFTDVHWECNGLLDMHRNPKAFYNDLGTLNADDVLVPEMARAVVWAGTQCSVNVTLSHFSTADLHGSWVEWWLEDAPGICGRIAPVVCDTGAAQLVGTVVFVAPALTASARLRLELRLYDARSQQLASNYQEIYVLARAAATPAQAIGGAPLRIYAPELAATLADLGYAVAETLEAADVALATTITDRLRAYVETGGRVLWLAEQAGAQQAYLQRLGIVARAGRSWQGDWASSFSWLRQDRMFTTLPKVGGLDFAFADLTPDQVLVGCDPADFAADVHAGLFVGWLQHTVALIAERHYGAGRLLASAFRLSAHLPIHPLAQAMVHEMLRYVTRRK